MTLLDRSILRGMLLIYAGVTAIILFLMTIENLPRLLALAQEINRPRAFLAESAASLIPEYMTLGLIVATFFATALVFRRMATTSELDIWAAAGVSNLRLLRVPIAIGLVTSVILLGLQFYIQPLGERNLNEIGARARSGDFGLDLKPNEIFQPMKGVVLTFDRIDPASGRFAGVFAQINGMTFTAADGAAYRDADGRFVLRLERGTVIGPLYGPGSLRSRFGLIRVTAGAQSAAPVPESAKKILETLTLNQLWSIADQKGEASLGQAAVAAILNRTAIALFAIILPFLAFALGMPARRSATAAGLGLGLVSIVAFLRVSTGIQDHPAFAIPGNGLHALFWLAIVAGIMRLDRHLGHGFIEMLVARLLSRLWQLRLSNLPQRALLRWSRQS